MKKYLLTLIGGLSFGMFGVSQDAQIAEPFFEHTETATARSMGTAGAFGSVGADFSNATSNPAGLAFFRKKELGLNLGYTNKELETNYLNKDVTTEKSTVGLNNIAYVYSDLQTHYIGDSLAVKKQGLVSWSLVLGMNKKAVLAEDFAYDGFNQGSSLPGSYANNANAYGLNYYEGKANDVGLVKNVNGRFIPVQTGRVQQEANEQRTGSRKEYFFGGGANVSNELYLGASFVIPSLNYETKKTYKELDSQSILSSFDELTLQTDSEYKSVGAYLNLGAIYRLNDYFRVGANVKTPTYMNVDETSFVGFTNGDAKTNESFQSEYGLILPLEAGLQLAASHPKYGLISIEGDYIDYSGTRLDYDSEEFNTQEFRDAEKAFKAGVKETYKGTFNLRGGLEARLLQNLRLRGGYAYYDSPFKNKELELGNDYAKKALGLGLGYRFVPQNITLDLGLNHTRNEEYDFDYFDTVNNVANNVDISRATTLVQLGISKRFNQ